MNETVMTARDLFKQYKARARGGAMVRAVDTVDLELRRGEVFGLLGESGSGKSTLAELMAGLQWPTSGEMIILGEKLDQKLSRERRGELRRHVQVVFQNPFESVNPRLRVGAIVAEPVEATRPGIAAVRSKVRWALEQVGLTPADEYLNRFPHELSGGQLQRVCIARALTVDPTILVADEPVSMLDLSVRAGILRLFDRLKRERDMAVFLISHDVSTLVAVSDRLGVMYLGQLVETGPTEQLLASPQHPYFRALLAAVPTLAEPMLAGQDQAVMLTSGVTAMPADGCRLAPRCPLVEERCRSGRLSLDPIGVTGQHSVRCIKPAALEHRKTPLAGMAAGA
jgi:oligopeptide/dipeptide ABC transporter ATP-binding protein